MGRVIEARYCAMGERCKLYDAVSGKAQKLGRYHKGTICDQCRAAGYYPEDTPPFDSKPTPDKDATTQLASCAKCGQPAVGSYGESSFCEAHWEQLHSEGVIDVFSPIVEPPQPPEETFSELFRAARVLFADNVSEEEQIVPTLAFANRASALPELQSMKGRFAKVGYSKERRKEFLNDFYQRFKGLIPVAVSNEVLVLRRVPMFLNAVRYPGSTVVKEVVIDVFMRSVTTDEVAEHYQRWLVEEGLAYDESSQGTFGWRGSDACVAMTVGSGKELNEGQVARMSLSGLQPVFPPPQLVAAQYESLKGSVNSRRFRGFAYALGGRQSGPAASPDNLIPACVAWYLRDTGGISDKHRLARLLNQHLLAPCGKRDVGVTSDNAIWKNIDKVADSIMRVELALQKGWDPRQIRVSKTHS
jgi:hypothetical protein